MVNYTFFSMQCFSLKPQLKNAFVKSAIPKGRTLAVPEPHLDETVIKKPSFFPSTDFGIIIFLSQHPLMHL